MKKTLLALAITGFASSVMAAPSVSPITTPDNLNDCVAGIAKGVVGDNTGSLECSFYHGVEGEGGYNVDVEIIKSDNGNLKLSYKTENEKGEYTNAELLSNGNSTVFSVDGKRVDNVNNGEFEMDVIRHTLKNGETVEIARTITTDESGNTVVEFHGKNGSATKEEAIKFLLSQNNGDVGINPPQLGIDPVNPDPTPIHGGDGSVKKAIAKKYIEHNNGDVGINPPQLGIDPVNPDPTPIHGGDGSVRDKISEEIKTNPDFAKEILPKAATVKVKANVERIKSLNTNTEKVDELNTILDGKATLEIVDAPVDAESGNGKVLKVTTRSGEEVTFTEEQAQARITEAKGKAEERQDTREPQPIELPKVGTDPERVQEAVQNLSNAGTSGATTMAELYSTTTDNALKIEDLYNQIDRLDVKMDGVMASTQAVTSARPYLFGGQTSAIGVGIGAAGSEQAIAVGYAHRINDNWSANANVSATSGNDTEVSAGAGVSFAW